VQAHAAQSFSSPELRYLLLTKTEVTLTINTTQHLSAHTLTAPSVTIHDSQYLKYVLCLNESSRNTHFMSAYDINYQGQINTYRSKLQLVFGPSLPQSRCLLLG